MRKLPFISLLVLGFSLLINLSTAQIIRTVAGNGFYAGTSNGGFSGDGGPATSAELWLPASIVIDDSENMYITDWANERVRKVTTSTGIITTIAGGGSGLSIGNGIPATDATLGYPSGIALDSIGNIYFSEASANIVQEVIASTGIIYTVAGNGFPGTGIHPGGFSGDGGPATAAEFYSPQGIAVDDSGNIYIADDGNSRIRKVTASTGIIHTIAGTGADGFMGDGGPATAARFYHPVGVCLDSVNNIYVADEFNGAIRKITVSTGIIITVAGDSGISGYTGDGGLATASELLEPYGVAFDASGNMYIANYNEIRMVSASSGIITTIAGDTIGSGGYSGDGGPATVAELNEPTGVDVDKYGNLYIADEGNNVIRKITYDTNTVTGTKQLTINNGELTIYPNPNNGKFTLQINNGKWIMDNGSPHLEIYNILGEQVYSTLSIVNFPLSIDLSTQPGGMYFYRVLKETGELVGDGKVVIEH